MYVAGSSDGLTISDRRNGSCPLLNRMEQILQVGASQVGLQVRGEKESRMQASLQAQQCGGQKKKENALGHLSCKQSEKIKRTRVEESIAFAVESVAQSQLTEMLLSSLTGGRRWRHDLLQICHYMLGTGECSSEEKSKST